MSNTCQIICQRSNNTIPNHPILFYTTNNKHIICKAFRTKQGSEYLGVDKDITDCQGLSRDKAVIWYELINVFFLIDIESINIWQANKFCL